MTKHLREISSGDTIVLVPGIDGTALLFWHQIPRLANRFNVVSFPLPDDRSATMESLVEDLAQLVGEVSPGRTVLLGESFGGALCMSTALAHPELVDGVVIVNSFPWLEQRFQLAIAPLALSLVPWAAMPTIRRLTETKTSSGPHPVLIPAGSNIVTATSTDLLHGPSTPAQTGESWGFVTDTGYTSGSTPDLADLVTTASHSFGEIDFSAGVASITFVHRGDGSSPNSVEPSLSLVCLQPPPPTVPQTSTTNVPNTTEQLPTSTTAPAGEVLPTTLVAPTTAAPTTAPPATTEAPTTTPGAVKPIQVERPQPTTLPRTGGEVRWAWLGLALFAAGSGLVAVSRREQPADS
ncbi:MAG: alpha/beta hydrolase [Actinomycetota bacterium]|nr:alpha/beta hydrolase [Actinomycetota bacterium]